MSLHTFLFLVANTPWVSALAEALGSEYLTHATRFYDWHNYLRLHPTWQKSFSEYLKRSLRILPPGYVGHLEPLFRPYLQWQVQQWSRQLQNTAGVSPWVIVPYPFSVPWVRHLSPNCLIYYNLDDYVYYEPAHKARILAQEAELINRTVLTLCLSQFQVEALKKRYPQQASSIHHFPLGVANDFINPEPERAPEPHTVGYVGNLIDRVDWQLVYQVAKACPDITFTFVGELDGFASEVHNPNWRAERKNALELPNVRWIGKVSQQEVARYYWSFSINWIPYDTQHPFNQASCPTKIMDGIASCRPVISTDIPECRLYPNWISIFYTVDEAVSLIQEKLSQMQLPSTYHHLKAQHHFASQQTWLNRAKTLILMLDQK